MKVLDRLEEGDLKLVREALKYDVSGHTPESVAKLVEMGRVQAARLEWPNASALIVAHVCEEPSGRELFIWLLAGKGLAWRVRELTALFDHMARASGCQFVRTNARLKVARVLQRRMGFRAYCIGLERRVK